MVCGSCFRFFWGERGLGLSDFSSPNAGMTVDELLVFDIGYAVT